MSEKAINAYEYCRPLRTVLGFKDILLPDNGDKKVVTSKENASAQAAKIFLKLKWRRHLSPLLLYLCHLSLNQCLCPNSSASLLSLNK